MYLKRVWEEFLDLWKTPILAGFTAFTVDLSTFIPVLAFDALEDHNEKRFVSILVDLVTEPSLVGISVVSLCGLVRICSQGFSFRDFRAMRKQWKRIKKIDLDFSEYSGVIRPKLEESLSQYLFLDPEQIKEFVGKDRLSFRLLVSLCEEEFRKKNYDSGLLYLRDFSDVVGNKRVVHPKIAFIKSSKIEYIDMFFSPSDHMDLFLRAVWAIYNNSKRLAYRISLLGRELAAEKGEYCREAYVFHALLSSALRSGRASQDWSDAAVVIRKDPVWDRIGETRSVVRVIKDSKFLSKSILFKEGSIDDLVCEAENIKGLQSVVRDSAVLPEVLYVSSDNDPFLIMRFLEGDTLLKCLEQGDYSAMPDVLSVLARIHSEYAPENGRILSLPYYVRSRLVSQNFGIGRNLARSIVSNYRPVYDSLKDAILVYSKDAHPENWIVGEKVGVIDCEGRLFVPAQFDLVNLLEYGDFFTDDQKKGYVDHYFDSSKLNVDRQEFMLGYWNSVIHRMLGLSSAWSSPLRPGMRPKRVDAIKRALHAIDVVESEHSVWFGAYRSYYVGLRKDLESVASLLS